MSDKPSSTTHAKEPTHERQPAQPASQELVAGCKEALASALGVQLAAQDPRRASPAQILSLQRAVGNRAVSRLLASVAPESSRSVVQARLTVGPAGDRYEQEAERAAEQVMKIPAPSNRRPGLQRQEDEEEVQAKSVVQRQADAGFEADAQLESRLAAQKGGGSPLPDEVRTSMEPRFGADFGGVRVHTDVESVQMAHELNAQAFTHGGDIYFGAGRYNPGSDEGKQLVAHELTHTIQQGAAAAKSPAARVTRTRADTIQGKWGNPVGRYNGAIAYLKAVNGGLAADVRANTNRLTDGMRISLGKAGKEIGSLSCRDALRALLLCLCAFERGDEVAAAIEYYKGRSQEEIDDAIHGWHTLPNAVGRLAVVAQDYTPETSGALRQYYSAGRGGGFQEQWGGNCYPGSAGLLYLAGVVSLRWFQEAVNCAQQGLQGHPSFSWTGNIDISHLDAANALGPGHLLCFWKGYGVHFAVSTGNGRCWGHNNPGDPINNWDTVNYGAKPGFTGEFSIAGWLVGTQRAYLRNVPNATQEQQNEDIHVQVASCIPNNVV